MTPADALAAKMIQQEHARLRERVAFFHGCADDPALKPESREASRRVADALGRLIAATMPAMGEDVAAVAREIVKRIGGADITRDGDGRWNSTGAVSGWNAGAIAAQCKMHGIGVARIDCLDSDGRPTGWQRLVLTIP